MSENEQKTPVSADEWIAFDEKVKDLDVGTWNQVASDEVVEATAAALEEGGQKAYVVEDGAAALEKIKELIPEGASVNNASSTTLTEIGYVDFMKSGDHKYEDVHKQIIELGWTDEANELRRTTGGSVDYFLSSISALTEDGKFLIADLSGSRVGPIVHSAKNVIIVTGANKIVKDEEAGEKRLSEFQYELESARVRVAYGVPASKVVNKLWVNSGNPMGGPRIHVIIIKEQLGF